MLTFGWEHCFSIWKESAYRKCLSVAGSEIFLLVCNTKSPFWLLYL